MTIRVLVQPVPTVNSCDFMLLLFLVLISNHIQITADN